MSDTKPNTPREEPPFPTPLPYTTPLLLTVAVIVAIVALVAFQAWLPGLSESLLGPKPRAYWYLARASGLAAFALLWGSMVLGLATTTRLSRVWPGAPAGVDLHQYTGLLGLLFALFHGGILVGDRYIGFTVGQLLVPFAGAQYRPLWIGLGQVGFYLLALVWLSFYARRTIGHRWWRAIHYLSFLVFLLALVHGVFGGTDSGTLWVRWLYWASAGSVLWLTIYRVLLARDSERPAPRARPAARRD